MSLMPTISWNPNQEADLAGYRIYYGLNATLNPAEGYVEILMPCRPMLRLTTGLTKYVPNYFRVTAFDTSNNESAFSEVVSTFVSGGLIMK
jgi:hypothetical protein